MEIEKEVKQEFITELMSSPLFSMDEKFRILEKLKDNDLSKEDTAEILDLIHYCNEGFTEIVDKYYSSMDSVFAKYLDKNIPQLKQGMNQITIKIKEAKERQAEGDSDLILDQIE